MTNRDLRDRLVPALLLALPWLVQLPALLGLVLLDPLLTKSALLTGASPALLPGMSELDANIGTTLQALGHEAAAQWLEGRIPWWNPYSGIGMPLAAEAQPAALFLPFVLLLKLANGPLLLKCVLQDVAALAGWALLRRLGLARWAAFAGAVMIALNGSFAWFGDSPILPLAFLPLLLLGLELCRAAGSRALGSLVVAGALAFSLLAGFPETAYLNGLLGLAWAGLRVAQEPARWRFAGAVALGGLAGLLLATPLVIPFLDFLRLGWVDVHDGAALLSKGIAASDLVSDLLPYFYGPPISPELSAPAPPLQVNWLYFGGYFGLAPTALGLLALSGRRERGLRLLLAGWIILAQLKRLALPGVAELLNLVPLLGQTAVYRYVPQSQEVAMAVLAACGLDDLLRAPLPRWRPGLACGGLVLLLAGALALVSGASWQAAAHAPRFRLWLLVLSGLALLFLACLGWGLRRQQPRLLALLLTAEAVALFAMPMASALRRPRGDLALVDFLRAHLAPGERFFTTGALRPNYGAFFRLPQLNHVYVPVPRNWVAYVHDRLDPDIWPAEFRADYTPYGFASNPHPHWLRENLRNFAALGVRFIVAPANPFLAAIGPPTDYPPRLQLLQPGESYAGNFAGGAIEDGALTGLGVHWGPFYTPLAGEVRLELCGSNGCARGAARLEGTPVHSMFVIPLDTPLQTHAGEALRYRIIAGDQPIGLYLWPTGPGDAPAQPSLAVSYLQARLPSPIFRSPAGEVYELANPAPYFSVRGGDCTLAPSGREVVDLTCAAPATLIRRELFFPGWRARLDGAAIGLDAADDILQSVAVPAGHHVLRFRYVPPHAALMATCFAAGCVMVAMFAAVARRRGKVPRTGGR